MFHVITVNKNLIYIVLLKTEFTQSFARQSKRRTLSTVKTNTRKDKLRRSHNKLPI